MMSSRLPSSTRLDCFDQTLMSRWTYGSLAGLLVCGLLPLLSGCKEPVAAAPPPIPEVIVASPLIEPVVEWDEYVGRFEAVEFVEVRARVSGYLSETHFQEGQIVHQGDLLATIDQRPFIAELNNTEAAVKVAEAAIAQTEAAFAQAKAEATSASARYDLARRTVERWRSLVARQAAQQEDLDTREAELAQAKANVEAAEARVASAEAEKISALANVETSKSLREIARLNLYYTEITAPITGRISRRDVTEGNLISGGTSQSTLLTTIVSLNPIHVVFDADEAAFLRYRQLAMKGTPHSSVDVRNPVFVALGDEHGQFPHQGQTDFIDNRLDQETGTIRTRAILPNEDFSFTPGLFARVRVPGSSQYNAVLVPDQAIGTDQAEKFVLKVNEKNEVVRQSVTLGPIIDRLRVIRTGLDGSEKIILKGIQRVRPGAVVTTEVTKIEAVDDGLPDRFEPVPQEKWIKVPSKKPLTSWNPLRLPGERPQQVFSGRSEPFRLISSSSDEVVE